MAKVGLSLAFCALALLPASHLARADSEIIAPPVLQASRVAVPPRIDGALDDQAWSSAVADDRFVQREPRERDAPSERTELRVVYDDQALYVAFTCHDMRPDGIVARLTRRDRDVESDWVGFLVDSNDDHATGYVFKVNAAGVQLDSIYYNDVMESSDWDAVWESAIRRDAGGWSAEFRVPLSALRFSARDPQEWGFQAVRYISRKKEWLFWAFVPRNAQGFVSRSGRLRGLERLSPARTIELRPYVLARLSSSSSGPDELTTEGRVDVGLDAKLGLSSDLTLDATINPDFGQVEADQVVLNLTRFETLFPEKRPFFLESLDLFQMPTELFYTRRIGQPTEPASHPPRIYGAAKLTGKVARALQIGVVGAVTGPETQALDEGSGADLEVAPARSYAVARARYDFGDASHLGVIGTAENRLSGQVRRAEADHDGYSAGLDGSWVMSSDWRLNSQIMLSARAGGPSAQHDDGTACAAASEPGCRPITRTDGTRLEPGQVGWGTSNLLQGSGDHYFFRAGHHSYSPKLDLNDLGFLPQFNEHQLHVVGGYTDYTPRGLMRSVELLPGAEATVTFDGVVTGLSAGAYTQLVLDNYMELELDLNATLPGTYDTHETFDGARYEQPVASNAVLSLSTDTRSWLVLKTGADLRLATDDTWHARAVAELALQLIPQLELSLIPEAGVERGLRFYGCTDPLGERCTVDDERRDYAFATLDSAFLSLTLRGTWTFSPELSLSTYAQLFLDRGAWSGYRGVTTDGLEPTIRRADLMPSSFTGDLDGDGRKDDDFEDATLNLNLVLRWEFRPGSTVIGVYTRRETSALVPGGASPAFRLSGLGTGPGEDALFLKLVIFVG